MQRYAFFVCATLALGAHETSKKSNPKKSTFRHEERDDVDDEDLQRAMAESLRDVDNRGLRETDRARAESLQAEKEDAAMEEAPSYPKPKKSTFRHEERDKLQQAKEESLRDEEKTKVEQEERRKQTALWGTDADRAIAESVRAGNEQAVLEETHRAQVQAAMAASMASEADRKAGVLAAQREAKTTKREIAAANEKYIAENEKEYGWSEYGRSIIRKYGGLVPTCDALASRIMDSERDRKQNKPIYDSPQRCEKFLGCRWEEGFCASQGIDPVRGYPDSHSSCGAHYKVKKCKKATGCQWVPLQKGHCVMEKPCEEYGAERKCLRVLHCMGVYDENTMIGCTQRLLPV